MVAGRPDAAGIAHRNAEELIKAGESSTIVGVERDQLESDDKFMRHLAQAVRNGLGDRAGWDLHRSQDADRAGEDRMRVSCQRGPEPVLLKWKGVEAVPASDFFVRSGPGTVKLTPDSAREYIRTRFPGVHPSWES